MDEQEHGCVKFLVGTDFFEGEINLDPDVLEKCVEIDSQQSYNEIVEVHSTADIDNLCCVSGCFHDAHIEKCERDGDKVYVLFDGVWGCKIELWFEGDADFCIDSRDPEYDDPTWYDSTLLLEDGYFYLVDDGDMKVEEINNKYCWFKGQKLKYHVIPDK